MGLRSRAACSVPFPPLPPTLTSHITMVHASSQKFTPRQHCHLNLRLSSDSTFLRESPFSVLGPHPGRHVLEATRLRSPYRVVRVNGVATPPPVRSRHGPTVFNCVRTAQSCGRTFGSLAQLAQNTRWWAGVPTLVSGRAWARVWERNCRGHGWGRTAVQTHSADLPWWSLSSRFPASTRHWLSPASLTSEEGRREERPPHGLNVHFP